MVWFSYRRNISRMDAAGTTYFVYVPLDLSVFHREFRDKQSENLESQVEFSFFVHEFFWFCFVFFTSTDRRRAE